MDEGKFGFGNPERLNVYVRTTPIPKGPLPSKKPPHLLQSLFYHHFGIHGIIGRIEELEG